MCSDGRGYDTVIRAYYTSNMRCSAPRIATPTPRTGGPAAA